MSIYTASSMSPPSTRDASMAGASPAHSTKYIERKTSNISQASSEGAADSVKTTTPRRVSIAKASNLTVALSGGNPKPKAGPLRRKSNTVFSTYKETFLSVDDGDLTFQHSEDDVDDREVYSLLAVREIKLVSQGSCQFQLKIAEQSPPPISVGSSGSSLLSTWVDFAHQPKVRHLVLRAGSNKEAMEWVATIKHELKNQILVCKNLFSTLQSEGHQDRAEPLFEQIMELLKVVYDGREHFEVAETLRSYGKWLDAQGRQDEAALIKRQAKAIKRRCEEGLDSTLSRKSLEQHSRIENTPEVALRRLSSLSNRLPPLKNFKG